MRLLKSASRSAVSVSIVLIAALAFFSCDDRAVARKPAPQLTIGEVGITSSTHRWLSINATLVSTGSRPTSHGVIYSLDPGFPFETETVVELGPLDYTVFEYEFDGNSTIIPDQIYYAKAYVIIDGAIYYSNIVQFRSLTGSWKQLASFPGPHRKSSLSFSVNGNVFVVGGMSLELVAFNDVWSYNIATDHWTQKSSFPLAAITSDEGVVFVVDDVAYIMSKDGLWKYDPLQDVWDKINDGLDQTKMLSFTVGSTAYAGYGHFDGALYSYNAVGNAWTAFPKTEQSLYPGDADYLKYSAGTATKGYSGYGIRELTGEGVAEFYEYDPASNTWTVKKSFLNYNDPRTGLACFSINNKIYFGLGRSGNDSVFGELWEYDPSTGEWSDVANLPGTERCDSFYCSSSTKGYIGLGFKYYPEGEVTKLFDFWEFTP